MEVLEILVLSVLDSEGEQLQKQVEGQKDRKLAVFWLLLLVQVLACFCLHSYRVPVVWWLG